MTIDALDPDQVEGPRALDVRFRHVGPVCVLAMKGHLGAGSLEVLEAEVDRLGRTSCHEVVLDLHALEGVDEAGVKVLTGLHHYVEARGGRLRVLGTAAAVREALDGSPLAQPCGGDA